jgi:acyl-CoA thioesterase FadM
VNRLLRLLWIVLRSRWAARCAPLGPCTTRLRVWPNDLDLFMHVNNGVYLTLCDLGRIDLMLRSGALGRASGRRLTFLVAAETVQFYRPLGLFQAFDLETSVVGWDEKAFFVQHRFCLPRARGASSGGEPSGEETAALALVEGRVYERGGGAISPREMLADVALPGDSPPLPDWVHRWREDQRALRRAHREAQASAEKTR